MTKEPHAFSRAAHPLCSAAPTPQSRRSMASAGLGLRAQHYADAADSAAMGIWFEVHAENYMVAGGPRLAWLDIIRARHPLSLHGVGLSLAADHDPDPDHLKRLRHLVDRFQPTLVSEHLAWSTWRGTYRPDLLPVPRSRPALERIAANIERTQEALGRFILIENPSHYLRLNGHACDEIEFLTELSCRTGCRLLLDVNNVWVSANNLGFDPDAYLDDFPADRIAEIHLAGHSVDPIHGAALLIDSHDASVDVEVWRLYEKLIRRIGPRLTLIERDDNVPAFAVLLAERARAERILQTESAREPGVPA